MYDDLIHQLPENHLRAWLKLQSLSSGQMVFHAFKVSAFQTIPVPLGIDALKNTDDVKWWVFLSEILILVDSLLSCKMVTSDKELLDKPGSCS